MKKLTYYTVLLFIPLISCTLSNVESINNTSNVSELTKSDIYIDYDKENHIVKVYKDRVLFNIDLEDYSATASYSYTQNFIEKTTIEFDYI